MSLTRKSNTPLGNLGIQHKAPLLRCFFCTTKFSVSIVQREKCSLCVAFLSQSFWKIFFKSTSYQCSNLLQYLSNQRTGWSGVRWKWFWQWWLDFYYTGERPQEAAEWRGTVNRWGEILSAAGSFLDSYINRCHMAHLFHFMDVHCLTRTPSLCRQKTFQRGLIHRAWPQSSPLH